MKHDVTRVAKARNHHGSQRDRDRARQASYVGNHRPRVAVDATWASPIATITDADAAALLAARTEDNARE